MTLEQPNDRPVEQLPPSLIIALKEYFGGSLVFHPTLGNTKIDPVSSLQNDFEYELDASNHIRLLPRNPSNHILLPPLLKTLRSSPIPWGIWRMPKTSPRLSMLQSLWTDAIHLFLNLQSDTGRPTSSSLWNKIRTRSTRFLSNVGDQKSGIASLLVLPQRDGETFQDLERDLQTHLAQFSIERQYLGSHRGVSKKTDFLEDIESAPGNISRHCLMHAFQRAAPFRSNPEANTTVQSYSRHMSVMAWSARHYPSKALLHDISRTCEELEIIKGVIKTQQKAHSRIIEAIDRSLPKVNGQKQNHHRSQGYKRPRDASNRIFIARSAWMKTEKVLEDVEQLQGEGKRLAEQTKQLVDIKVEDQGKAVMVFTIVTVIFLPLSFVSSYFGMNTADVRNLQQGQWGAKVDEEVE
ncbi:MAG: hypothetical protein Q9169_000820 [Polycauliona sp. 2 TL-2023]